MPALTLRPLAREENEEAHDGYEKQRPGLGAEFLAEATAILASVESTPRLYPIIRGDVRCALLCRFPYSILYVADPEASGPGLLLCEP